MSEQPFYSVTMMNETGDITLTWDDDKDEEMRSMIQDKINKGHIFFIFEPREGFLKLLGRKKVTIYDIEQLRTNKITMKTDADTAKVLFKDVDFKLGDVEADKVFKSGKVGIANVPQSSYETTTMTKDVSKIMKSHTVMINPIAAG